MMQPNDIWMSILRNPVSPRNQSPRSLLYLPVIILALLMIFPGNTVWGANKNKLTIENQSGEDVTVRIMGVWEWMLDIPANEERTLTVPTGFYRYLVRYGPGTNYRYSRGKSFELERGRGGFTEATLTLISAPTHQHSDPQLIEEFNKPVSPFPVVNKSPGAASPDEFILHRVRPGETFPSIIRWYSGIEEAWPEAAKYNPNVDPLNLKPGIVLKIPTYLAVINDAPPPVKKGPPPFRHGQKKTPPAPSSPPAPAAPTDDGFGPK
jgi:hypothetical protein